MGDVARGWFEEMAARAGLDTVPPATRVTLAVACVLLVVWAAMRWAPAVGASDGGQAVPVMPAVESSSAVSASPSRPASVTVHVVGAVRRPGVYVLATGARACDAVDAAGGMLRCAEQASVNLARVVDDGEQIVVPRKGEAPPAGSRGTAASVGKPGGGKVDVNRAGIAELDALPGVGPSTAQKIVDDRAANGPFRSVEDLLRVPGIGPAKLDGLKDLVTAG